VVGKKEFWGWSLNTSDVQEVELCYKPDPWKTNMSAIISYDLNCNVQHNYDGST
jgi:hypothetical protein